jgi:hypothetical protein
MAEIGVVFHPEVEPEALPVLEQIDLLGAEVVPVLRRELAVDRPAEVPDAPTHAARVAAVYGDGPARQARPTSAGGNNLTVGGPYQDTRARVSEQGSSGSAFGVAATRKETVR